MTSTRISIFPTTLDAEDMMDACSAAEESFTTQQWQWTRLKKIPSYKAKELILCSWRQWKYAAPVRIGNFKWIYGRIGLTLNWMQSIEPLHCYVVTPHRYPHFSNRHTDIVTTPHSHPLPIIIHISIIMIIPSHQLSPNMPHFNSRHLPHIILLYSPNILDNYMPFYNFLAF